MQLEGSGSPFDLNYVTSQITTIPTISDVHLRTVGYRVHCARVCGFTSNFSWRLTQGTPPPPPLPSVSFSLSFLRFPHTNYPEGITLSLCLAAIGSTPCEVWSMKTLTLARDLPENIDHPDQWYLALAEFFASAGKSVFQLFEGTTEEDPLDMGMYGLAMLPLIKKLAGSPSECGTCADDALIRRRKAAIAKAAGG